jgi:hypothetical protein
MFSEPAPELVQEYGITWDQDAYGSDSPIHESIASYLFPGLSGSSCTTPNALVFTHHEQQYLSGLAWNKPV